MEYPNLVSNGNAAPTAGGAPNMPNPSEPLPEIGRESFNRMLLESISRLQSRYIQKHELQEIFNQFILEVLRLTGSEYSFVGEVLHKPDGKPYLKIHDISHIARDEATRRFFEGHAPAGAEFHNLDNLFGWAVLNGRPIIANEPREDPRWGGRQPHGHPPMHNFMGLPLMMQDEVIGLVGLANRPGGYPQELIEAMQPVVSSCATLLQAHRDERDRREAEKALEGSEARFRTLTESVPVILWTAAPDGTMDYISRYWFEYSGLPEAWQRSEGWLGCIHREDWAGFMEAWRQAVAKAEPFSHELRMRRASDGSFRWHLSRAIPVRGPDGSVAKWLGTSVDIHDQKAFADLKQIKDELASQKQLLEAVVHTMGDGLIVSDADGRYLIYNPEAARILGFTPEEIVARREELAALIRAYREDGKTPLPPEDGPLRRALAGEEITGEAVLLEGPMYPGGRWLNIASRPLPWLGGRAALAVFQDITFRKRAEIAMERMARAAALRSGIQSIFLQRGELNGILSRSLEIVAAQLDASFAYAWFPGPEGSLELVASIGNGPDPAVGYRLPRGQGKVGQVAELRRPVLANDLLGDPAALRQDWIRDHRVVAFAGFPMLAGGELVGVLSFFSTHPFEDHDLDLLDSVAFLFAESVRRRQAQEAMEQSEERFRTLVAGVQDYAIFMLDTDGGVRSWNAGAERITGYSADEISRAPFGFLYPEEERSEGTPDADLARCRAESRIEMESVRMAKGGRPFWAAIHIAAIKDGAGALQGYSHVIRDITEKKKLDEALRDRTRQLEALNRELEAFSYSVSHDLRAPLRSLDGFSRALEEGLAGSLDETSRGYLSRIRKASERMGTLIDALLDLSRLQRSELVPVPVDLTALARQTARDLAEANPGRTVEVEVEEGMETVGDRALLERLLANLMGNAWKFTGPVEAPRIEVGRSGRDGAPAFFVRDNGVGFDMAYSDKLFGAFQRLHGQAEFPGTGIGLALGHRIVKRHGGDIWAESAPGKGAAFYFTLGTEGNAQP